MRKIVVFNAVSLDGYHTGPGNDVSVMFPMMGGVFDAYTAELLRAAGTTLLGRVSFELFNSFWPEVARDPVAVRRGSGPVRILDLAASRRSPLYRAARLPRLVLGWLVSSHQATARARGRLVVSS